MAAGWCSDIWSFDPGRTKQVAFLQNPYKRDFRRKINKKTRLSTVNVVFLGV